VWRRIGGRKNNIKPGKVHAETHNSLGKRKYSGKERNRGEEERKEMGKRAHVQE